MKISFSDDENELLIYGTQNIKNIIEAFDDKGISNLGDKCLVTEDYGIRNKSHFTDLKKTIEEYREIFSVNIDIDLIREYIFRLRFEGKLGDILGLFSVLNITNRFYTLHNHLGNDVSLINSLLGMTPSRREIYDYNHCLTLRLLADLNKHDNLAFIHDQISNLLPSSSMELLKSSFETIYGEDIDDLNIDENINEMSTSSIDDNKLDTLKRRLKEILNGGDDDGEE